MKFEILVGLFSIFFLISFAQGACLEISEINTINSMESQLNISNNSLMNLMESMCIRVVDAQMNITNSLDDYTNTSNTQIKLNDLENNVEQNYTQRMNNYTDWFNEQLETSSILAEMLKVLNASKNIEDIDTRFEDKTQELINQMDDRFESYITIERFNSRLMNMTTYFGSSNVQSSGFFGFNEALIFWMFMLTIAAFLAWKWMDKKQFPTGFTKRLPFRRKGTHSLNELKTDTPTRRMIEKKVNEQIEREANDLTKDDSEKKENGQMVNIKNREPSHPSKEEGVSKHGEKTVHDTIERRRKKDN